MQKITVYDPESLSDCDKLICEVCACTVIYGSEKCFNDEKRKEWENMQTEYHAGLIALEEKKKELIAKYQDAREDFYKIERELNEVYKEIEEYKEGFGIMQNVR